MKIYKQDNVSEWLRRQIRNLLGSARASSNLVVVDFGTNWIIKNPNTIPAVHVGSNPKNPCTAETRRWFSV